MRSSASRRPRHPARRNSAQRCAVRSSAPRRWLAPTASTTSRRRAFTAWTSARVCWSGWRRATGNSSAEVTATFPAQERTRPAMLRRQAARFADRRLFVTGDSAWTYADTLAIAGRAAAALTQAGIKSGDAVAILCGNRSEYMQAYRGCAWLGAVVVPINIASRGAQLHHILSKSRARLLIGEAALLDVVAPLVGASGVVVERIWLVGGEAPSALLSSAPRIKLERFKLSKATQEAGPVRPGDPVAILYTSGTTGLSKGVLCPQSQ